MSKIGRWRRRTLAAAAAALLGAAAPTPARAEPAPGRQWYLDALHVAQAHRLSTGRGVVVAVIDAGVQADHPDLAGRVLAGRKITGDDDRGQRDRTNHGTGVAGLIAARGGGRDHALGIAPDARILPVSVHLGTFGPSDEPAGIRWAVDHGARVLNLSIGGEHTSDDERAAVRYAQSHDVVVVAAAGNAAYGDTAVTYPARLPGVLAVSATDRRGRFWSGSVRGPEVGIAAPGVDMRVLASHFADGRPGGYVQIPGGTSASTALVAGAAALVRARFPRLSAAGVINRLVATADDAGPPGRDPEYGYGRLDLLRALTARVPDAAASPLPGPPRAAPAARRPRIPRAALLGYAAALPVAGLVALAAGLAVRRRGRRRRGLPGRGIG